MTFPCWKQFSITKENLLDEVYQKFIIRKMNKENSSPVEDNYKMNYKMHLPLDSEDYYQNLLDTIINCAHCDECCDIEDSLLTYITANLYNTVELHEYSVSTRILAANVYFELIKFNSSFLNVANYAQNVNFLNSLFERQYNNLPLNKIKNCINSMIDYAVYNEVPNDYMKYLAGCLVKIALFATCEVLAVDNSSDSSIDGFALHKLKQLLLHPERRYNTYVIYRVLLTSYTRFEKYNSIKPQTIEYAQNNVILYVRTLFEVQGETEKNKMLIAFLDEVCNEHFIAFNKFVYVLTVFDQDRVKSFLKKITSFILSKQYERKLPQLLKMTTALINVFNSESVEEKYFVHLQLIMTNIIRLLRHNRLNKFVLEQLHLMCTKPNRLFNKLVKTLPANFTESQNLLSGFGSIFLKLYNANNNTKMKLMLVIFLHFMANRINEINENECASVIYKLALSCTPHSFKPIIPLFHEKFYTFIEHEKYIVSNTIIKVFFKFATCNTATSMDYIKYFYQSLTKRAKVHNRDLPIGAHSIPLLLTDDIKLLMVLFRDNNLIKRGDINRLFQTIRRNSPSDVSILCHFIEYSNDRYIPIFVDFILHLGLNIIRSDYMCVVYATLKKLLEKPNQQLTPSNLQQLDIVYSHLADQLKNQFVHLKAFNAAFELWIKLADVLKVSHEETLSHMKGIYMVQLQRALTNSGNFLPICYAAKFIMVTNTKLPSAIINVVYNKLVNQMRTDPNRKTKWVPLLILFVNCSYIKSNLRERAIQCCKLAAVNADKPSIRKGALKVYYNYCSLSVKDFTDFNEILFTKLELRNNDSLVVLYLNMADSLVKDGNLLLQGNQFFKMVAPLTSSSYYYKSKTVLENSYVMNDHQTVAKFYILLLFYVNDFREHPQYVIDNRFKKFLPYNPIMPLDIHSMYQFVFQSLPMKKQFQILMELRNLMNDMLANKYNLKSSVGLMSDVIRTFEIMVTNGLESPNINSKSVRLIWSDLVKGGLTVPKSIKAIKGTLHTEHKDSIKILTTELLSFYHSEHLSDILKKRLFKMIIHWTMHFIKDVTNEIYPQRNKRLLDLYKRINPNVYMTPQIN